MPWWRNAVVYQVYLRSFADGNGDGTGDIAGLRSRLPYISSLGVDALWINPWYVSPLNDGGYDVADYRKIDPRFGTLEEAIDLIEEANRSRSSGSPRSGPQSHFLGARLVPGGPGRAREPCPCPLSLSPRPRARWVRATYRLVQRLRGIDLDPDPRR